MQCFIYKSLRKEYLYLYITKKDDFTRVPEPLLEMMGKIEFVMDLDLTTGRKLASEDAGKVVECLKDRGYFVQMPRTDVVLN